MRMCSAAQEFQKKLFFTPEQVLLLVILCYCHSATSENTWADCHESSLLWLLLQKCHVMIFSYAICPKKIRRLVHVPFSALEKYDYALPMATLVLISTKQRPETLDSNDIYKPLLFSKSLLDVHFIFLPKTTQTRVYELLPL